MPISISPEPRDPVMESRQRVHALAELANSLAHRIVSLRHELRRLQDRIRELEQGPYPGPVRGRHVGAAVLAVVLLFGSWAIDFIVLSPLADFLMDWSNMAASQRVPLRIALAFIWTVFGYGIGAKLGVGFHTRQRAVWFDLVPALAYVLAMPVIAYFVGYQVFQGPARWMLIPMTAVLSIVPVLSGYYATTAAEYLAFLTHLSVLKARERSFGRRIALLGDELQRTSARLAVAVDELDRQFGERPRPYLTELAQQLINEFGRGNINVTLEAPAFPPPPRPLPAASANPAPEPQAEARPASGNGNSVGVPTSDSDAPNAEIDYLRRQLEERSAAEDAELTPPTEFSTRLP